MAAFKAAMWRGQPHIPWIKTKRCTGLFEVVADDDESDDESIQVWGDKREEIETQKDEKLLLMIHNGALFFCFIHFEVWREGAVNARKPRVDDRLISIHAGYIRLRRSDRLRSPAHYAIKLTEILSYLIVAVISAPSHSANATIYPLLSFCSKCRSSVGPTPVLHLQHLVENLRDSHLIIVQSVTSF